MNTLDKVLFHPWVLAIGQVVIISGTTLILVWAFNYSERPFWMWLLGFSAVYAHTVNAIAHEVNRGNKTRHVACSCENEEAA